ncbi:MAG: hypothetical protein CMK59_11220 [Proteobacteria bacterium]|nr:hypothetical protein [Pseudomonadota bacterium]
MRSFLLIPLILIACDPQKSLEVRNSIPVAEITSHNDGDVGFVDEVIEFRGSASDPNNAADELEVAWRIGDRIACPFATPDEFGVSTCVTTLAEGESEVQMEVRDPDNATAVDTVTLELIVSEPPSVEILEPFSSQVYYADTLITFSGIVSDNEDSAQDLQVEWNSSIDGVLDLETIPDTDGTFTDFGYLTAGEHGLELSVEDSSGRTNSASLTLTVKESNTPPDCAITSPVTGSAGPEGEMIIFSGTVSDVDIPSTDISVAFISSIDGEIGTSIPNSDGEVTFPYSDLSVNTHVISLVATDEAGAECISDVVYTVGSAPQISLVSPVSGSQYSENEAIIFEANVSDNEDQASALSLSWSSSIDGEFSTQGPNSTGIAQFSYDQLSPGSHSITVTATDSDGMYSDAVVSLSINGLPTAPSVTISPDPAYSNDSLTATATGSTDPDGQSVSYTFEWFKNAISTGINSSVLPSAETAKGDSWTVRVTPNDGIADGPFTEATRYIMNSTPEISSVAITPNSPTSNDILTCAVSTFDADGDAVSLTYEWLIDGSLQPSQSDTLAGPFVENNVVTCRATPSDGSSTGITQEASTTITNTPPTIASVTLSPSIVDTETLLVASVSATDPEGDAISYLFEWYVNGSQVQATSAGSTSSDTLDGLNHFDRDDIVYVDVTASDASASSILSSSTITVINTPPGAFNGLLTPAEPMAGQDDLVCSASASDLDGDNVTLTYAWEEDGVLTSFTGDTIPAAELDTAEVWTCIITPDDGTDYGSDLTLSIEIGANHEGAEGSGYCASAGVVSNDDLTVYTCLAPPEVAGDEVSNGTVVWQPGPMYVFVP